MTTPASASPSHAGISHHRRVTGSSGYRIHTSPADAAFIAAASPRTASAPTMSVQDPASAVPKMTTYRTIDSAASAPRTHTTISTTVGGSPPAMYSQSTFNPSAAN